MKITIRDEQRGILWVDGRATEWLEPGRHVRRAWWGRTLEVDVLDLDRGWVEHTPELEGLIPAGAGDVLDVPAQHVAVLEIDGRPAQVLREGRYILWRLRRTVAATVYDLRPVVVEVPTAHLAVMPGALVRQVRVKPWTEVLLYVDGTLERVLQDGLHLVAGVGRSVEQWVVDLRVQERQVVGQELMTADQVTLRLSLVAQYRIVDAAVATAAVEDIGDAVYTEVQLAARRLVASLTLDELLTRRHEAREMMTAEVTVRATEWGVEIRAVDIKDVVLPGEMKTLLNRVLEAEKQAAADVIRRREETAATRSLANTARMLEQNPMLLRLKELEAMTELADRVETLNVVAGAPDWAARALGRKD